MTPTGRRSLYIIQSFESPGIGQQSSGGSVIEHTLLAYFSLMLSSIATALNLEKSSGEIWIRSERVVYTSQPKPVTTCDTSVSLTRINMARVVDGEFQINSHMSNKEEI